ncbi:MAG: YraN family protein [Actinobacteria bacterium]|jgi:putative endonuclease|nr:YraN family protein [Actinomycetota bacterium]NCW35007.1 YraN family protein [Actinomycetota bacterium]NCZ73629.1 YraN family protein [Actinomycetota bacterium]NDA41815.1 YraN family protein [Actinomycetota bacterium]NDB31656.1 YraN family protein [Actinomycetota bacterium]
MAIRASAQTLGSRGEDIAVRFLTSRGYFIIDRNWRIREGELDIVAKSPEQVFIFIEVKARSSAAFGDPLEAISKEKALRIQRLALAWLATHQLLGAEYRIDAIGILIGRSGEISIDHRAGVL